MKYRLAKLALWFLKNCKYSDEKTKNLILTEAVCHLFNTVSSDDILKENPDGTLQFEGKTLPKEYKKDLREQAKLLPNLMLWKVIQKDIEYQVRRKMFEDVKITQDLLYAGKLILWLNECVNTRIKKLSE